MKNLFILYPHYWPDFSAGGPVQSIFNLVGYFSGKCRFSIISKISKAQIHFDDKKQWTNGPHNEQIFITDSLTFITVFQLLRKSKSDAIYINGVFTAVTTLPGLLYGSITGIKTIISPRGMLQAWALQKKGLKKKLYLPLFRLLMPSNVLWHATNEMEADEIRLVFGSHQRISIASNIPRRPVSQFSARPWLKQATLKLVFLSLINSNKNLEIVIDAVKRMPSKITLDIYGPVADQEYWQRCQLKIAGSSRIHYRGVVSPEHVQEVLSQYHFFVLPTMGENFGHAIFDALSSCLPVIISRNTPWHNIETMNAGYYCEALDVSSLCLLLERVVNLSGDEYLAISKGAWSYAMQYLDSHDYEEEYRFLIE